MSGRVEKDFLGEREIPDNIHYGVQTLRGIENFQIAVVERKLITQETWEELFSMQNLISPGFKQN